MEIQGSSQVQKIARQIMLYSRDTLIVKMRFLDAAISQLKLKPSEEVPYLATDGQALYYSPRQVLSAYKIHADSVARASLHVIFHCLFHHPLISKTVHQGCWDLACDIAIENAIDDLGQDGFINYRNSEQQKVIGELKQKMKLFTAEKIYRHFLDQDLNDEHLAAIRGSFIVDDHSLWYQTEKQKSKIRARSSERGDAGGGGEKESSEGGEGSEGDQLSQQQLDDLWKKISERAQVDIETASIKWGDKKGGLHQGLNQVNREKYDYASFLQRFSVLGEVMKVNDEEFDLIFYTYGLSLYKNMPLIEPLEYKEVKRIKEFVIAIDTSGSVQGKTVQMFIQKTYNILKQTENFFTRINLHIIQCDAAVQEDIRITNAEEFEKYIQTMTLRGFGGTDFRPVFAYVDQMIEKKEFENLKGLIYFTDGYGTYPAMKPDYDTAFIFLDEDYMDTPDVPSWAIKLVLSTDDIMEEPQK